MKDDLSDLDFMAAANLPEFVRNMTKKSVQSSIELGMENLKPLYYDVMSFLYPESTPHKVRFDTLKDILEFPIQLMSLLMNLQNRIGLSLIAAAIHDGELDPEDYINIIKQRKNDPVFREKVLEDCTTVYGTHGPKVANMDDEANIHEHLLPIVASYDLIKKIQDFFADIMLHDFDNLFTSTVMDFIERRYNIMANGGEKESFYSDIQQIIDKFPALEERINSYIESREVKTTPIDQVKRPLNLKVNSDQVTITDLSQLFDYLISLQPDPQDRKKVKAFKTKKDAIRKGINRLQEYLAFLLSNGIPSQSRVYDYITKLPTWMIIDNRNIKEPKFFGVELPENLG